MDNANIDLIRIHMDTIILRTLQNDDKYGLEILNEIKSLLASGITFDMQSMQGIGYKEFKDYFDGKITLEQVKDLIILNSRHYAKRQITWFKRYDFAKFLTIEELLYLYNCK